MYLIAEFREKESVQTAVVRLKADGVTLDNLDLFSEEPVELPKRVLDRPSRMSFFAVSGAILAGILGTSFIYSAQHNYKLPTGGMPLFSFWASGVITYEITMLGAIVSTFGLFLWESGLIRKRDKSAPVPEVAPESICIRVRCPAEKAAQVDETMRRSGAIGVERISTQ